MSKWRQSLSTYIYSFVKDKSVRAEVFRDLLFGFILVLNAATTTSNRIMNIRCNPPLLRHTHNSDHTGVRRRRTHFLQDTQKRSPATRFKQLIAQLALLDNLVL